MIGIPKNGTQPTALLLLDPSSGEGLAGWLGAPCLMQLLPLMVATGNSGLPLSPQPYVRKPCGSVDMAFASDCPPGSLARDLALLLGLGAFTEFLPESSALKFFSSELRRVRQS